MRSAGTPVIQVLAARLDVVQVGDDDEPVRQRVPGVPQLTRQGDGRILGVFGRGPAQPRDGNNRRGRRLLGGSARARRKAVTPGEHRVRAMAVWQPCRPGAGHVTSWWDD